MIELGHHDDQSDPVVLAAFAGWNDAGESASAAITHLVQSWDAQLVAEVDPEDYYDFQVNRPRVVRTEQGSYVRWPTTKIYLAEDTGLSRAVLLIEGIEPSIHWRRFCDDVVEYLVGRGASMLVLLGGLLADVPHTRPIPVGASTEDKQVQEDLALEAGTYEGPTGIVGVLADHAQASGIPTVSVWAAIPHYAGGPPSPKASLALVTKVEDLLGCVVARDELQEQARAWERGVNELAESDEEVREYVTSLEEALDAADHPEASGESIAREFERYLQRRSDDDGSDQER